MTEDMKQIDAASIQFVAQAIGAEIDRQCGIGAGMAGTAQDGSGLFEVNADLDLNGFAIAMIEAVIARRRAIGLGEGFWVVPREQAK